MTLWRRFQAWRAQRQEAIIAFKTWWAARDQSAPTTPAANPYDFRLMDGVDYRQPYIVPSSVAAQGKDAIQKYLLETDQTYRHQFDSARSGIYDGPVYMPTEDPLYEPSRAAREFTWRNSHAAYHRNPLAKRAVDLTRQFAIGKGFNLTVQNRKVKEVLDAFLNNPENNIKEYEKTLLQDLLVDGEIFIRFFQNEGETVIVPTPPWWVVEIETDPEFFRRVKSYKVQPRAERQDFIALNPNVKGIPAAQVLHVAINHHSYELRGRSDLFVILPWLRAYKEWMEDRLRQNKWRGALLWDISIESATPGIVAQKAAQYRTPPTPGSNIVHSNKETWAALTNPVGANDASEDGRQIKLMNAVGVGLPEYMLSDGQNANLASATAQQLPSLWKFVDAQEIMKEQVWTPILKRVIEAAEAAGVLPAKVRLEDDEGDPLLDGKKQEQMVPPCEAFSVEYHELQSDDPKSVSEALTMDIANDLVSRQTAQTKKGYDPDREKKLMDREEEERRDKMAQGQIITPDSIGLPGDGQAQPGDNGAQKPPEQVRANGQTAQPAPG
jgi:hypothetical protein